MARLASELPEKGGLEDQVGPEHPQVAMGGVVIEQGYLGHHRVKGHGARVVRDDERARRCRDVFQAGRLDAKPRPVERPQYRHEDVVVELSIESELIDGVVAGASALDELPDLLQRGPQFVGQGAEL